ncbi:MAG: cobyrinate a,c-diamide synthase [Deltaproteobacteria bacterium]|nr:cobyrinate a,c-diamide synthase [Deltaproteobacteria bacterium]
MRGKKGRAFIVAGTGSGVGKTIVALGVMETLRKRGFTVQPFKSGPDYIDPGHHRALLKRPSYNLDTWMMGVEGVKKTFCEKAEGVSVIEGAMGLFDGRDGGSEEGSAAHLSKVLKLPVLLVVDARKMARSAGAVVRGFETFDPEVDLRWVVFNRVGSPRHSRMLKDSLPRGTKVKVIGCLPMDSALSMPERHLGLVTHGDLKKSRWGRLVKRAAALIEKHVDLAPLAGPAPHGVERKAVASPIKRAGRSRPIVKIAVALDSAFCFYYEENLEMLKSFGAEIEYFSPMRDKSLPEGIGGLYLGGGYPEFHAEALESNSALRDEIRAGAKTGLPIFAECGGLMYLGRSIEVSTGERYSMAGVFPWRARMLRKRQALGYREVTVDRDCPLSKEGGVVRGHEFHYSGISRPPAGLKRAFTFFNGDEDVREGYLYKNTLATYVHLHFSSNPAVASGFVDACAAFKRGSGA